MGVNTSITCSTRQVLVLTVWDMEVRLRVTVLLSKAKVDNVDLVTPLSDAHQEVVRFDVAVDEGLGMDVLDTGDELIGQQQNCLHREFAVAKVEEILQAGSKEVENHGIVVTLGTEPTNKWDADSASQGLVDASFILELRMLSLDTLELDGDLFSGDDVGALLFEVSKDVFGVCHTLDCSPR